MTFGSAQIDKSKRSGCLLLLMYSSGILSDWQPTLMFVLMGRASRSHALPKGRTRGQTHYAGQQECRRLRTEYIEKGDRSAAVCNLALLCKSC